MEVDASGAQAAPTERQNRSERSGGTDKSYVPNAASLYFGQRLKSWGGGGAAADVRTAAATAAAATATAIGTGVETGPGNERVERFMRFPYSLSPRHRRSFVIGNPSADHLQSQSPAAHARARLCIDTAVTRPSIATDRKILSVISTSSSCSAALVVGFPR